MNYRRIVLIIFLLYAFNKSCFSQTSSDHVYLSGIIKYFSNKIQIEDMSEMKDINLPDNDRIINLDTSNHFAISFTLEHPGYFRLGRNILYLTPGDSLIVFINRNWPDSSNFKGIGSEANEYLKCIPFPKAGSFLEAGDNCKQTISETLTKIFKIENERKNHLKKYIKTSSNFKFLEEKRIEADVLNSLIMIPTYFPDVNHLSKISEKDFRIVYKKVVSPYINSYSMKVNLNPTYLQLGVYRQVVRGILEKINSDKYKARMIKEWMRAVDMVAKFKTITERKRLDIFSKEINGIKTKKYRDAVVQAFEKLMKLRNGDEVVNFTMTNTRGELISLDSFKGKVIYIDFWATWCLPCLTELTYLDSLKKRYQQNDNIILISLSIDENKQEWLKKVINSNENHNEYIIDRLNLESYSVTEIPRTLLIGKDFKIVSMEANLPSDKNLVKLLDELIK